MKRCQRSVAITAMLALATIGCGHDSEIPPSGTSAAGTASASVPPAPTAAAPASEEPAPLDEELAAALERVEDDDERAELRERLGELKAAVAEAEAAVADLGPLAEKLAEGDADAVADAAARDPEVREKVVKVAASYEKVDRIRDAITVILGTQSPSLAADFKRIVDVLTSDLPFEEKLAQVLEIVLRRLQLVLQASSGQIGPDLIRATVEDGEEVVSAAGRLVQPAGGGTALEVGFEGGAINLPLPDELTLDRLRQLLHSDRFDVRIAPQGDGTQLVVRDSETDAPVLHLEWDGEGRSTIVVD